MPSGPRNARSSSAISYLPAGILERAAYGEITRRGWRLLARRSVLHRHHRRASDRRDAVAILRRVQFEHRSIFETYRRTLSVCRTLRPSTPAIARSPSWRRSPGRGWHLIRDYLMIHFEPGGSAPTPFWRGAARLAMRRTNLRVGRCLASCAAGLVDIKIDYGRRSAARVCDLKATMTATARRFRTYANHPRVHAHFEDQLATLDDPDRYAVWHVPVVAARIP